MASGGAEELIECPYDKHHQILRGRIQTHLIKCRRNHKDAKKATCPFNSTHVVNEKELNFHVENCEDRGTFEKYKYIIETQKPNISNTFVAENKVEIEPTEDWSDICVPTYNPNIHCRTSAVIRQKIGGTPSERKAFREAERARFREFDK